MESGDTPDFALWPQPGAVVDAANRGYLIPMADLDIDVEDYKNTVMNKIDKWHKN